ncbi:AAA family ATPase [Nonomuraea wenchangensis]|uniref:AAA family ATPase n=1 Tax=Nonomuraea wenchangensis TaxID=568860 RepID=UPI00331987C1
MSAVVITGIMASGKSTVAQRLAERLPRAAHVRGDAFRRMVVSGRAEMTPDPSEEALRQLRLRHRLTAAAADLYAEAGFTAVVQDIVLGAELELLATLIRTRPLHVVVLAPRPEVVAARERGRAKIGYAGGWTPAMLDDVLRRETPRLGLWLDTSEQTPDETAEEIITRWDEAIIVKS